MRANPNGVEIAGFVSVVADELAMPYRPVFTVAMFRTIEEVESLGDQAQVVLLSKLERLGYRRVENQVE